MQKSLFWPASLLLMGVVILISVFNIVPKGFIFIWSLIMIVTGLVGVLTADQPDLFAKPRKNKKRRRNAKRR